MPPFVKKIGKELFVPNGRKFNTMKLSKYTLDDFSGGFSAHTGDDTMESKYTPNSYNVEALGGSLKTMPGCSKYIDSEIINNDRKYYAVQFFVYYSESMTLTSELDKLVVVGSTFSTRGLFLYNSGAWTKLQGNISEKNMGGINCIYNNENTLFICNSADGIYTYNPLNSEIGYIDSAPGLGAMTLHYERIWGIGDTKNPNTVYYSAESDFSDWDTTAENADAGKLDVTTFDGDSFIGIANVFDDVVLYRKKTLFRITGSSPSNYQLKQIPAASGAVGANAIANNGRYSFYIGQDGIYSYDGIRASLIEDNRLRFLFENRVNQSMLYNACAVIFGNKLYAAVPVDEAVYNNLVIEYDITSGVFNIRSGVDIINFGVFRNELIFADNAGYVCVFDGSDKYKGTNIEAHYETPFFDFDNKNVTKTLDSIYFTAKGTGKIKITAETENGITTKTVTLKNADKFDLYKINMYNTGRRFKFCFDNVDGSTFEITRPEFFLEADDED